MKIRHTISGPRRNTSSTYGQEIARSKKTLENALKEKNKQQMKYILSVAELKAKGKNLSLAKLKKLLNNSKLRGEMALEKIRLINLYLNNLSSEQAKRFIKEFEKL